MDLRILVGAAFAVLFSTTAHAALLTFNFAGGGANGDVLSFVEDGVTLTARGAAGGGGGITSARINHNNNGLGIRGGASNQLDAEARSESIEFELSSVGSWVSAELWRFRSSESMFTCTLASAFGPCELGSASLITGDNAVNPLSISLASLGSADIALLGTDRFNRGSFRIQSITVDVAAVPEPASLVLFSLALVGLAARRRWRKANI